MKHKLTKRDTITLERAARILGGLSDEAYEQLLDKKCQPQTASGLLFDIVRTNELGSKPHDAVLG